MILSMLLGCGQIAPWTAPPDRDLSGWGTLDEPTALALQGVLDRAIEAHGAPGLQASIRTDEGLTWVGAAGTADWERTIALQRSHSFRLASCSKMFTAAVVLGLVGEGRIGLDDPASRWLGPGPALGRATVRDLLGHTAGVPELLGKTSYLMTSTLRPRKWWEPREIAADMLAGDPEHAPGASYSYSNTHAILLGLLVEEELDTGFAEALRERVLIPAGLQQVALVPWDAAPQTLVSGYDRDYIPLPGRTRVDPDHTSWATLASTAGAVVGTAEELRRFTEHFVESAPGEALDFREIDEDDPRSGAGLGVFRHELAGRELWGHEGSLIGFHAIGLVDPETGLALGVAGNVSQLAIFELVEALLAVLPGG